MKIRLSLEALTVESFETSAANARRGTVHGNACSDSTCFQFICDITNGGRDNGTCDYSCGDPCSTNVNCSGGTGGTGTGPGTRDETCATGDQFICRCP
ncbi:MAG TPA: pinensin family lanthipeptide [Longimicrobium sp.]|nr:pinensin family lanthipeptide [Longimicrobium sp.]